MATISTTSNEGALTITSNNDHLDSPAAVHTIKATNSDYNQPVLRIRQASTDGGAASIRIDGPNPDIEFVETPQDPKDPAKGKYEIAVQSDKLLDRAFINE